MVLADHRLRPSMAVDAARERETDETEEGGGSRVQERYL